MNVWVTGAHGMLGRALARQLDRLAISWFGSDQEVDIADAAAVRRFTSGRQTTAIFNAAAYTAVDSAETDELAAMRANGTGPEVLAGLAREIGAGLVHVSTDYVFDGTLPLGQQYREDMAPCPANAYGRTKLRGELAVRAAFEKAPPAHPAWLIVRTSWLFGKGRSSFVDTMWRMMLEKEELRVVSDQIGRPTYVEDLAGAVIGACGLAGGTQLPSGIWHFANCGMVSWYEYAVAIRDVMLELGLPVKVKRIDPVPTEEFPRPARRPKNSVLDTTRIERASGTGIRSWQVALREYLEIQFADMSNVA